MIPVPPLEPVPCDQKSKVEGVADHPSPPTIAGTPFPPPAALVGGKPRSRKNWLAKTSLLPPKISCEMGSLAGGGRKEDGIGSENKGAELIAEEGAEEGAEDGVGRGRFSADEISISREIRCRTCEARASQPSRGVGMMRRRLTCANDSTGCAGVVLERVHAARVALRFSSAMKRPL